MEEKNTQLNNDKNIKVLRTYTSDMAEVIRDNEVSVIKIALAEKEKREQENMYKEAEGTNTSKTFLVIGGIVLIVIAIVGSYFLIQQKKSKENPPKIVNNIETFIAYDSSANIDVTNIININELTNIIKKVQPSSSGVIKALFLTKKINDISTILTSNDFLSLIKANTPGALIRSLSDKYLIGKYNNPKTVVENSKSAVFLIFQTTNYNQAYASMLDWEKTMLKDLHVLFEINIQESNSALFEKQWKDIIINNKDARVLYGDSGEAILYYVFINRNDFIITNNLETLKEIIARLITKNAQPL